MRISEKNQFEKVFFMLGFVYVCYCLFVLYLFCMCIVYMYLWHSNCSTLVFLECGEEFLLLSTKMMAYFFVSSCWSIFVQYILFACFRILATVSLAELESCFATSRGMLEHAVLGYQVCFSERKQLSVGSIYIKQRRNFCYALFEK